MVVHTIHFNSEGLNALSIPLISDLCIAIAKAIIEFFRRIAMKNDVDVRTKLNSILYLIKTYFREIKQTLTNDVSYYKIADIRLKNLEINSIEFKVKFILLNELQLINTNNEIQIIEYYLTKKIQQLIKNDNNLNIRLFNLLCLIQNKNPYVNFDKEIKELIDNIINQKDFIYNSHIFFFIRRSRCLVFSLSLV